MVWLKKINDFRDTLTGVRRRGRKPKNDGADAWPTIFGWIDQADLVLVLLTDKTVHRALSVGQEIGHATKAGKTIIPMVGENVPVTELGCLAGVTYIPMKLSELSEATAALEKRIDQMSEERKRLETEREAARESEKKNNIIKTAGIALILYNLLKE